MYHVITRTIDPSYYGILTITSYKSPEDFEESQKRQMLDGTNRLLSEVYQFVFGSYEYSEVRDYMDKTNREPVQKEWRKKVAVNNLIEMQKNSDEPLPDSIIEYEIMKALI